MAKEKVVTSRVEEIRHRRTERVRKPNRVATSGRGRKAHAPYQPPVVVRWGQLGSRAAERQVGKKARRRFDVALSSVPGAEIRLPSLPSIHLGWRFISGLLVAVLAFTLYTAWNHELYIVNEVEIEGVKRLPLADLNAVIGVTGDSILAVNPEKIQADLLAAYPELSQVSVEVSVPANVMVKVVERLPVLTWKQDGQVMLVDATGMAFKPRGLGQGEEIVGVLVEAESKPSGGESRNSPEEGVQKPSRFLPPQLVTAVLAMSTRVPPGTSLIYTLDHGLGWKDPRGWQVFFGTQTGEMESKLRVYEAIVNRLAKERVKPALISVEFLHAPYYRLEQ
jgi:cell division protein FtsQ